MRFYKATDFRFVAPIFGFENVFILKIGKLKP